MTRTEQIDNIMRLTSLFATARVRRYVAAKDRGDTNAATERVDQARAQLLAEIEKIVPFVEYTPP